MKKVLLFLYPINEFLKISIFTSPEMEEIFYRTLEERYRSKDYQICFVTFPDKKVGLNIKPTDKIITTDISFVSHTTPIGEDEKGEKKYIYPSEQNISNQLGQIDEIIVCGFHTSDCVKKVAKHFHNMGVDTLVDIELTDMFIRCQSNPLFNPSIYNLSNYIEFCKAEDLIEYGELFFSKKIEKMYNEPFYKKNSFIPTSTSEEIISLINKNEQHTIRNK